MKRKFWALLFSLAITIGLTNHLSDGFWQSSVSAQSAPEEFSLEPMNIETLDAILQEQVSNITTQPGQWRFSINEISIVVLADGNADRMRIFAPVINTEELTPEQTSKMMLANFHTALDARYAITDDLVVSTFIHPLSSLQKKDLLSALNQVSSLVATFGTQYSSGELLFVPRGNGNGENPPPPPVRSSPGDIDARKLIPNFKAALL